MIDKVKIESSSLPSTFFEGLLQTSTPIGNLPSSLIPQFERSNMSRSRSLDHFLSLIAGFAGGLAVWAIRNWVIKQQSKHKNNNNGKNYPYGKSSDNDTDIDLVIHNGACHCKRVKFRIKASRLLQAVDIPSKIRFPRLTVPISSFEALTDDTIMSHYAVKFGKEIGIHTFCSYCGVHVVFAPSIHPTEVLVNLHCIDKVDVDDEYITYYKGMEAHSPIPMSSDEANHLNKTGKGMINIPQGHSPQNDPIGLNSWVRPHPFNDHDNDDDHHLINIDNNMNMNVSTIGNNDHHLDIVDAVKQVDLSAVLNSNSNPPSGVKSSQSSSQYHNNSASATKENIHNYNNNNTNKNNKSTSINDITMKNMNTLLDPTNHSNNNGVQYATFDDETNHDSNSILNLTPSGTMNVNMNISHNEVTLETPKKKNFAFDSPMHRQLQRHLQRHLNGNLGD